MQHLPKTAGLLALLLAFPILCSAWTSQTDSASKEFGGNPGRVDSLNQNGAPIPNNPVTAINIPADVGKATAAPKPLYPPNVTRNASDSRTAQNGLASLFSFLLPSKTDLDKFFKGEDENFQDRGRSNSNPFQKRDWK